jgi:hypothetical protein
MWGGRNQPKEDDNRKRPNRRIISKIEASQDGSPYVYVTFSDPGDYKGEAKAAKSFWSKREAFLW